jgi:hypothetical protein
MSVRTEERVGTIAFLDGSARSQMQLEKLSNTPSKYLAPPGPVSLSGPKISKLNAWKQVVAFVHG